MDQMGRTSVSMVYSLGWGAAGMGIGAAALAWIPIVGPVVGGLVGESGGDIIISKMVRNSIIIITVHTMEHIQFLAQH